VLITVSMLAQLVVMGGFALGSGMSSMLSSMRAPSRRRSNTKSTRVPCGGTVVATPASASWLQIRVGTPFTSHRT